VALMLLFAGACDVVCVAEAGDTVMMGGVRLGDAGVPRWGHRYRILASPPTDGDRIDLNQLASPDQGGAPWEARDWTVYVRPQDGPQPSISGPTLDEIFRAPMTLNWQVGGGGASSIHLANVSSLGGAYHLASTAVGVHLSSRGGTLGAGPTEYTGAIWVSPGRPILTWRTLDTFNLAVFDSEDPSTVRSLRFPPLATGRFRVESTSTAALITDDREGFPLAPIVSNADLFSQASSGVLATYHIASGATGVNVRHDGAAPFAQFRFIVEVFE
jgi:hypothetical protein